MKNIKPTQETDHCMCQLSTNLLSVADPGVNAQKVWFVSSCCTAIIKRALLKNVWKGEDTSSHNPTLIQLTYMTQEGKSLEAADLSEVNSKHPRPLNLGSIQILQGKVESCISHIIEIYMT